MKTYWKIVIGVVMIALSTVGTGFALPLLYFEDNVAPDTRIANRASLEGYFDLQSTIAGFTTGTQDRHFNHGRLHFAFTDDNDLREAGHYYSPWERKLKGNTYHFERRRYDILQDAFEMVEINALGTTTYKSTGFYIHKQKSGLPDLTEIQDRWGPFDSIYRTELYTSAIGWGGDIYYSMALNDDWLERISTTGILQYNLRSYMGDMVFRSAVLELDANPGATPVPEPSTFLLVFLSGGLMGGAKIIRKLAGRYRIQ
jgi:hypothetical protein